MTARITPIDPNTYKPLSREEILLGVVLNNWPPARKIDLIPAKQLLAIRIANVGVDIMIVEYGTQVWIVKDAPTV